MSKLGEVIVSGSPVGKWVGPGTQVHTERTIRSVCIGGIEEKCRQIPKNKGKPCGRPHTGEGFKPSITIQATDQKGNPTELRFYLDSVYKGEEPPKDCDYVLFDYPRQIRTMPRSEQRQAEIVKYTPPPTQETLNAQPQLCQSAWGQSRSPSSTQPSKITIEQLEKEDKLAELEKVLRNLLRERIILDGKIAEAEKAIKELN